MIRLLDLLTEQTRIRVVPVQKLGKLYHGTAWGDRIRQTGRIEISSSGFGKRGLLGVALTPDEKLALRYAESHARYDSGAGNPEVLVVKVNPEIRLADLRGAQTSTEIWKKLGLDPKDEFSAKKIEVLDSKYNGMGITFELRRRGFDGAVVDNTLPMEGSDEVCIFDPANVKVVARKLNIADFGPLPLGKKAHPAPFKNWPQSGAPPGGDGNFAG